MEWHMSEVLVVDSGQPIQGKNRRWLWILLSIIAILAIAIGGFVFWALNPTVVIDEIAYNAIESNENITITDDAWLAFLPHTPPTTGVIIYPGGRVPALAYAPIARQIADAGYLVVIVYPPLNLAILNTNLATPVIEHFSAVEQWIVGGHSLGGSAASIYTNSHMETVDGLFFMASYPLESNDFSETDLDVTSIYGTNDGLVALEDIEASRDNVPAASVFVEIEGGNHAQFGYYGTQSGDNEATIAHDEQITQTVDAILDLLFKVERNQ